MKREYCWFWEERDKTMDDMDVMNNTEVVETTTDVVNEVAEKNPILGLAVGACAAVVVVGVACFTRFVVMPKLAEKKASKTETTESDRYTVVDGESNDSGNAE